MNFLVKGKELYTVFQLELLIWNPIAFTQDYPICEAGANYMNVLPIRRGYQFLRDPRRKTIIQLRGNLSHKRENQINLNKGKAGNRGDVEMT